VGKGKGGRAHDMHRGRNRFHKFIQAKLSRIGMAVDVRLIAMCLTENDAFALERERISFWRADGVDLANITDGGDGPSGRKHTEEWKLANSERMKGRKPSAETRAKMSAAAIGNTKGLGKKRPEEASRITAEKNRGKKRSAEVRLHLSEIRKVNPTFKGRHHTAESIAKIKAPQIGRPKSEETKAKMRKPKSEEHKRKIAAIRLGKKHTPETLAKLSDAVKRGWENRRRKAQLKMMDQ